MSNDLQSMLRLAGMRTNRPTLRRVIAESTFFKNHIKESLELKRDKQNNLLVVFSNLPDDKAAKNETFKLHKILKSAGFSWSGTNWTISDDQFEHAKTVLTTANKADYIIDSLEDLSELVSRSEGESSDKSEIKSEIDKYISDLANSVDEKAMADEIQRYLKFFASFHQYSFHNKIMIYIQRPDAKQVAGYKAWQERNRQVKKGSKAIFIYLPIKSKKKDQFDNNDTDTESVVGFKLVPVFDISDTVAMNDEGEVPEEPTWWGDNTPSETADDLFHLVKQVAEDEGITISAADAKRGEKGFSAGGHINITSNVEGAGRASTMVHELAHELMHWKETSKFYAGDDIKSSKAIKELQAESVSFVVLRHYGIDVEHHSTYLALWKANSETIKQNLQIISKVSKYIIEQIDALMNSDSDKGEVVEQLISEMVSKLDK